MQEAKAGWTFVLRQIVVMFSVGQFFQEISVSHRRPQKGSVRRTRHSLGGSFFPLSAGSDRATEEVFSDSTAWMRVCDGSYSLQRGRFKEVEGRMFRYEN
jgi:hypothetical protein